MASGSDPCEAHRAEFIRLLEGDEGDEWRIAETTALHPGRLILPSYQGHFGAYAINLFILDLLRGNFPMHAVVLKSGDTGCVMNVRLEDLHIGLPGVEAALVATGSALYVALTAGRSLYIKLKIQDEIAVIVSFHLSSHDNVAVE